MHVSTSNSISASYITFHHAKSRMQLNRKDATELSSRERDHVLVLERVSGIIICFLSREQPYFHSVKKVQKQFREDGYSTELDQTRARELHSVKAARRHWCVAGSTRAWAEPACATIHSVVTPCFPNHIMLHSDLGRSSTQIWGVRPCFHLRICLPSHSGIWIWVDSCMRLDDIYRWFGYSSSF